MKARTKPIFEKQRTIKILKKKIVTENRVTK